MRDITIERNTRSRRRKSRRFSARLLALLSRRDFVGRGFGEVLPWWIACGGPTTTLEPFVANLRGGFKARSFGDEIRIPKSSRYGWRSSSGPAGQVTVAYDPALLHLEPTVPEAEDVRFLLLPSEAWLARARRPGLDDVDLIASLFAAYVDRRTRWPVLRDVRFHRQMLEAARDGDGLLREPAPDRAVIEGLGALGFRSPWWFQASHREVEGFLIEQTARWRRKEIEDVETRIQANRGLLPHADPPAFQLCLAF